MTTVPTAAANAARRLDPESQWCYWMMDNLSPNEAMWCVKQYACSITKDSLASYFAQFCKDQPELIKWMKVCIVRNKPNKNEDSAFYYNMNEHPRSPGEAWYRDVATKHKQAMDKFGFGVDQNYDTRLNERMDIIFRDKYK